MTPGARSGKSLVIPSQKFETGEIRRLTKGLALAVLFRFLERRLAFVKRLIRPLFLVTPWSD